MIVHSRRFRLPLNNLPLYKETRRLLGRAWPLGVAALVACAPAHAESPGAAAGNRCARLGSDFVAISGAQGCVRLGGHVRAEAPRAEIPRVFAPRQLASPGSYAAAGTDGVRPAAETFHIRAGAAGDGSDLYRR
jgi:hypothetical protein